MKTYDIYGFYNSDLESARKAAELSLEMKMVPHESMYIGEYYLGKVGEEEIQIRRNWDPLDGELVEKDFPDIEILLYVNKTEQPEEVERLLTAKIPNLVLLKRKEL
jgi:hypothetical protein